MQVRSPEQLIEFGKRQLTEGRLRYAHGLFSKALKEGRHSLAPEARAGLLKTIGKLDRDLGHLENARVHYAMSAEITRTLNDPPCLAHTLRHVADIFRNQKKFTEAEPVYAESLAIYRAESDTPPLDLANALRGYALLKEALGQPREAIECWGEARSRYEQAGVYEGVEEGKKRIADLEHDLKARK